MFQILARCRELEKAGRHIRHFELGDPNFETPGPISSAAIQAITSGNTHYQPSRGNNDLIEAVQMTTSFSRRFFPEKIQITVTTGANSAIFYTLKAICDPGDEVLLPNPFFPTYIAACHLAGATEVLYPLMPGAGFIPDITGIEALITKKTKAILVNSPSNPTGAVFDEETIASLYRLAIKHDLYLISDEVYARMIFGDSATFVTPAKFDHCLERTIVINGFSKTFAMTGWRIGVVIAPPTLSEKITLISESIVSCVPGFVQDAARQALLSPLSTTKPMYEAYRRRQIALCSEFSKVEGMSCSLPQGAMYVFPSIKNIATSSERFAYHLLNETGVATVPGVYFGALGESHLRFSCAGEDADIEGLSELFKAAIANYVE